MIIARGSMRARDSLRPARRFAGEENETADGRFEVDEKASLALCLERRRPKNGRLLRTLGFRFIGSHARGMAASLLRSGWDLAILKPLCPSVPFYL